MSEWIPVNVDEQPSQVGGDLHREAVVAGVQVEVFMSPYDMPEAVRGRFDETLDRFIIEFRYMTDEPIANRHGDQYLTMRVGKNSNRLYGIEIDTKRLGADSVGLKMHTLKAVDKTIHQLVERPEFKKRRSNWQLVNKIIQDQSSKLLRDLVPA